MAFAADIKRWATVADFEAYLKGYDPRIAPWADGVTLHHTYTPTLAQWRGLPSVHGTLTYYIGLGWDAGPHLFIAHGSANPDWDGIYQLTPLNLQGIHAGACNSHMWGIEIVGRYDDVPWSKALTEMVYGVTCALLNWRDLGPNVKGHRECLPNKSCPGRSIDMNTVRDEISRRLAQGQTQPANALLTERSSIFGTTLANKDKVIAEVLRRGSAYDPVSVRTIVTTTFDFCAIADIPGEIGIAQQFVEDSANIDDDPGLEPYSSYWALRPHRNPAGIGVTGAPGAGVSFPTWVDGIQAQIGRLLRYFLKDGVGTEAQQALMATAMHWRPLDHDLWGSATMLAHLGAVRNPTGKGWADPGDAYGQHIADVANMLRGL